MKFIRLPLMLMLLSTGAFAQSEAQKSFDQLKHYRVCGRAR